MAGKQIGYIRVSSTDQNTARQLEGVELDKTFTDQASGKNTDRPQWQSCREYLREDDVLHVHSIDRLARNLQDLLGILTELTGKGIAVYFHKESLTFAGDGDADPFQRLQLQIIGAVAEFERALIRERQREGIAIAKEQGRYRGRKTIITPAQAEEIQKRVAAGHRIAVIAREMGVSRPTVYARLRNQKDASSNHHGGEKNA